jgi:pilus assembly protein CpaE
MTLLFEGDAAVVGSLRVALGDDAVVVDSLTALRRQLELGSPGDLVVSGPSVDEGIALEFAASSRVSAPALGVVLVRRRVDSAVLRDAMRAGVREVVKTDDLPALENACHASRTLSEAFRASQGETAHSSAQGRVVTVFAGKGGCGKTTMATNLSAALSAGGQRSVCLLDLDLAFGDVAIALQLFPSRTLADAVGMTRVDESAVRSLVTTHPSGLDTIVAPVSPGEAESISGALVSELLLVLRRMYEYVVIDCPPAFTEPVLAAFDQTDHFVLLATLDVPALKNLKLTLETLTMLNYERERWHVALNRSDAKVGLSVADVEKTLGTRIAVQVPSSRAVPTAINRGVPIVLDQPSHPVSTAIRRFAESSLLPAPSAKKKERRGFASLRRAAVTS